MYIPWVPRCMLLCGTYPYWNANPAEVLSKCDVATLRLQFKSIGPYRSTQCNLLARNGARALDRYARHWSSHRISRNGWRRNSGCISRPMVRSMVAMDSANIAWQYPLALLRVACSLSLVVLLATVSHANRMLSMANAKEAAATQHALSQQKIATNNAALADEQSGLADRFFKR